MSATPDPAAEYLMRALHRTIASGERTRAAMDSIPFHTNKRPDLRKPSQAPAVDHNRGSRAA